MSQFSRRRLLGLLGAGAGALVGLPALSSLEPRELCAATARTAPLFLLFKPNGIAAQGWADGNTFPELFFPDAKGTRPLAEIANKRALGAPELADHVADLSVVRNTELRPKSSSTWKGSSLHPTGPANAHIFQSAWLWSGGKLVYDNPSSPNEYAVHVESPTLDYVISKALYGREPLVVAPWGHADWLKARICHGENGVRIQPRVGAKAVYDSIYQDLAALVGENPAKPVGSQSINDLLNERFKRALASPRIGKSDRLKLELHQDSISVLHAAVGNLACSSTELAIGQGELGAANQDPFDHCKVLIEVAVLAASCGIHRVCNIQIGHPGDGSITWKRPWNGQSFPGKMHALSHHNLYDNGQTNPEQAFANPHETNAEMDRLYLALYAHLLRCLKTYGIYDESLAVFWASMGWGRSHEARQMPFVLAGSAGGYLKTGVYTDVARTHGPVLNTLASAAGMVNADGSPLDAFSPNLETGVVEELFA